jgi:hypothetical protein
VWRSFHRKSLWDQHLWRGRNESRIDKGRGWVVTQTQGKNLQPNAQGDQELKWSCRVACIGVKGLSLYWPALISHWIVVSAWKEVWLWARQFLPLEATLKEGSVGSCLLATPSASGKRSFLPKGTWVAHCIHHNVHFQTGRFMHWMWTGEPLQGVSSLPVGEAWLLLGRMGFLELWGREFWRRHILANLSIVQVVAILMQIWFWFWHTSLTVKDIEQLFVCLLAIVSPLWRKYLFKYCA